MTIYYLYQKTHINTGLKYLGYTTRNPFIYHGSGIKWGEHLREHGVHLETTILAESTTKAEIKNMGRYYSDLWDIVDSTEWANSMRETCGGPGGREGIPRSSSTKKKLSEALRGRKHTNKQNLAKSIRQTGKPRSAEWIAKMTGRKNPKVSEALAGIPKPVTHCPHCGKSGGSGAMGRWHFDNCRDKR
jgi:hypothetical protein